MDNPLDFIQIKCKIWLTSNPAGKCAPGGSGCGPWRTQGVKRRLAAILAADVVGYSRLMRADEEGTLVALRASRHAIEARIGSHGGRIANTAGDSVMAEFPSAVEAVRCATAVQADMRERNKGIAEARRMQFRMGLNLGDIIIEGTDIFGDGVNLAARLQEQAPPGGILISSSLYDQVVGKVEFGLEYVGVREVKNFAEPIPVYRVLGKGERPLRLRPSAPSARPGEVSEHDWGTVFVLALLLGWFGAHRYYVGRTRTAIIQLVAVILTGGFTVLWTIYDLIVLWRGKFTDELGRPIPRTWPRRRVDVTPQRTEAS